VAGRRLGVAFFERPVDRAYGRSVLRELACGG
jgi:hypothetical protein